MTTVIWPDTPAEGEEARHLITLVLSNEFDESARLTTDLDGAEVRRTPFVDPLED